LSQFFGEDAGFADDAHEIGIAEPARQRVKVDVTGDAGAGGAANVHAQIHAIGLIGCGEGLFDALRELHHFIECGRGAGGQFGDVGVGNDHDVAGCVGIAIENDEAVLAAMDDERLIVASAGEGVTENAIGWRRADDLLEVGEAPRGKEMIHRVAG